MTKASRSDFQRLKEVVDESSLNTLKYLIGYIHRRDVALSRIMYAGKGMYVFPGRARWMYDLYLDVIEQKVVGRAKMHLIKVQVFGERATEILEDMKTADSSRMIDLSRELTLIDSEMSGLIADLEATARD